MWNHICQNRSESRRLVTTAVSRPRRQRALQPLPDVLEDRQLLAASLAPISNLAVPAQLGYQAPLNGSGNSDPSQTYTATSDNPDILVSVAQGPFWTVTVSHQPADSSDVTINNESMTFQLFQDLTPNTVNRITNLTNSGYYTKGFPNTSPPIPAGQYIPRITSVAGSGFAAVQGGSSSPSSTASSSGIPPIATEPVQQLAFTGQSQIAMANTGQANSTDAQFFITSGTQSPAIQQAFDFNYTIFGQLVSGQQTLNDLTRVAVQATSFGEFSQPITPVTINSVTLSSNNPNGVLHIDTTSARSGETATVTVTATDPENGSHVTESFKVVVTAYNGPTQNAGVPINFVPFASPVTTTTQENAPVTVQLIGQGGFPDPTTPPTLTYQVLSQPAHGTLSQFNAATGSLVYTPNLGYSGPDSFQYMVQATVPKATPATTASHPATVSIAVTPPPLVTLSDIDQVSNKGHRLTQILVHFSGAVNATQADQTGIYRLALPGRKGSYTARNAPIIKIKTAVYSAQSDTVALQLRTPLALGKKKVQLRIAGLPPSGLTDSLGRLIDGDHNGTPGGNAIAYISRFGVSLALEPLWTGRLKSGGARLA
jgi:cyclophilin family peptidyl-prolyl cis-trans isomerase